MRACPLFDPNPAAMAPRVASRTIGLGKKGLKPLIARNHAALNDSTLAPAADPPRPARDREGPPGEGNNMLGLDLHARRRDDPDVGLPDEFRPRRPISSLVRVKVKASGCGARRVCRPPTWSWEAMARNKSGGSSDPTAARFLLLRGVSAPLLDLTDNRRRLGRFDLGDGAPAEARKGLAFRSPPEVYAELLTKAQRVDSNPISSTGALGT
jgi:hypothetical protein